MGGQSCQISALYRKRLRSDRENTVWDAPGLLGRRGFKYHMQRDIFHFNTPDCQWTKLTVTAITVQITMKSVSWIDMTWNPEESDGRERNENSSVTGGWSSNCNCCRLSPGGCCSRLAILHNRLALLDAVTMSVWMTWPHIMTSQFWKRVRPRVDDRALWKL